MEVGLFEEEDRYFFGFAGKGVDSASTSNQEGMQ
jgi:hypothetical protein